MRVDIYIEGERIDLFQDDTISVTSRLQDIQDISKLYTDYSQSFTVPASSRNNRIFKQYYNADITNGYDARIRKDGSIDINTLDFKRGKIRLDEVKLKQGVPESYRITFFGKGINLKDEIGDDTLNDLEWLDSFAHSNDGTTILTALKEGLDFTVDSVTYEDAIIYPLISYGRQYYFNGNVSDTTFTDTLSNISYNSSSSVGIVAGDLRPCINLPLVIKAIEEQYNVEFTGTFFDSSNFQELYMNINGDEVRNGLLNVESPVGAVTDCEYLDYTINVTSAAASGGSTYTRYKVKILLNGTLVYFDNAWKEGATSLNIQIPFTGTTYALQVLLVVDGNGIYTGNTKLDYWNGTSLVNEYTDTFTSVSPAFTNDIVSTLPQVKVYDFLESLFKTFNLVITPEGDDIYINDLQTWYSEGQIYDITKFVDTSSKTVKKGIIYNEINFNFAESDQILTKQFRETNKQGYGDLEFRLTDENGIDLANVDGGSLDINVLFENPIYERLVNQNTNALTPIQYCPMFDDTITAVEGNIVLMYLKSVPVTNVAYNPTLYPTQSLPATIEINDNIFMPSHSKEIDQDSFNVNFNAEVNEYTSQVYQNTIFNEYYSDYIGDMFSIKRRIYNYKAELPANLLNQLKLNDRLVIKDRRYIINTITSDLINREDTLELINDIYDAPLASDTLNTSVFRNSSGLYNSNLQSADATYIGVAAMNIVLVDTGDGTDWITLNTPKTLSTIQNVNFDLSQNLGFTRSAQIQVQDSLNEPKFTITQLGVDAQWLDFSNSDNTVLQHTILTGKN